MLKSKEILEKVSQAFVSDTFFTPVIGTELEFYLFSNSDTQEIHDALSNMCVVKNFDIFDIKEEKGKNQFEISLKHKNDVIKIADEICRLKQEISNLANENNIIADFRAKPLPDDYGSSLHIHVSLLDQKNINILQKIGDEESKEMHHAIAGLLDTMPASMQYLAPTEECYQRFVQKNDAPTTISWGGNNRTVAIRLPTSTTEPHNRRIEHRLASAMADPYISIAAVLAGIAHGIENKLNLTLPKIFGDAALEQYAMQKLPANLDEAKKISHDKIQAWFK